MSDRTWSVVVVHDCPPSQRAAALAALRLCGLHPEFATDPADRLVLGMPYVDEEGPLNLAELAAAHVSTAAPDATFEAMTDPFEATVGEIVRYAPDLGTHTADFDGATAVWGEHCVQSWLTLLPATATRDDVQSHLGELFGVAHRRRLERLAAWRPGTVVSWRNGGLPLREELLPPCPHEHRYFVRWASDDDPARPGEFIRVQVVRCCACYRELVLSESGELLYLAPDGEVQDR